MLRGPMQTILTHNNFLKFSVIGTLKQSPFLTQRILLMKLNNA